MGDTSSGGAQLGGHTEGDTARGEGGHSRGDTAGGIQLGGKGDTAGGTHPAGGHSQGGGLSWKEISHLSDNLSRHLAGETGSKIIAMGGTTLWPSLLSYDYFLPSV